MPGASPVDEGFFAQIHGVEQWITIRGRSLENPIMMIVPGPGAGICRMAPFFAPWERDFTIVQWDQPGAGATHANPGSASRIGLSYDRLVTDAIAVVELVCNKLGVSKLVLLGFSAGTILGLKLIKRRPDVRQAERRLAGATADIGVATADLYPTIRLVGLYGGAATEVPQLNTNIGRTWGIGPTISWAFPNMAGPRARVRQAKAAQAAALASFDSVVLTALKETEQALSAYNAGLENRESLGDARDKVDAAYGMAHDQFLAGSLSALELLTTEQSLVAIDAAVAASDATLVQDQIAVFKALGGGWRSDSQGAP